MNRKKFNKAGILVLVLVIGITLIPQIVAQGDLQSGSESQLQVTGPETEISNPNEGFDQLTQGIDPQTGASLILVILALNIVTFALVLVMLYIMIRKRAMESKPLEAELIKDFDKETKKASKR